MDECGFTYERLKQLIGEVNGDLEREKPQLCPRRIMILLLLTHVCTIATQL